MTALTTEKNTIKIAHIVKFIDCYREFEKKPLTAGYEIIRHALKGSYKIDHLCNHWRGKEKDFGSFFLNLDTETKIRFANYWDFKDEEDQKYLADKKTISQSDKPYQVMFMQTPVFIYSVSKVILFFNNRGISEDPNGDGSIKITKLPGEKKRYGNSANWGNYVLSLHPGDQNQLIRSILNMEKI